MKHIPKTISDSSMSATFCLIFTLGKGKHIILNEIKQKKCVTVRNHEVHYKVICNILNLFTFASSVSIVLSQSCFHSSTSLVHLATPVSLLCSWSQLSCFLCFLYVSQLLYVHLWNACVPLFSAVAAPLLPFDSAFFCLIPKGNKN